MNSIEEKAKAYDEAIKKAESLYNAAEPMSGCNVIIETLFSELKESQDERIRKAIKKALQVRCDGSRIISDEPVTLEEAIAWLEKQGEHTKFTEEQGNTELRQSIEVALKILVKLLENDKFQKDAKEYLFDKGDKELSSIYDIYAKEAVKYAKALFKQIENEY